MYRKYPFLTVFFVLFNSYTWSEQIDKVQIDEKAFDNKNEELSLSDEKFSEEFFDIIALSYKEIIDLSALYFCGLINWDKLYDQMITMAHKDFFKIIKLFAWYIPSILKNPKISNFVKIKKTVYVTSSIVLFWYISREIFINKPLSVGLSSRDIKIDKDEPTFNFLKRRALDL